MREDAHFAAIVESSDDAILSKDHQGLITSWNTAAQRIFGWTAEEAIGQHISILIPPHRAGEEKRIIDKVFAGERVEHYETERVTKDGEPIQVSLSISPVRDVSGRIVLASVISRDVTARIRSRRLAEGLRDITSALAREITPQRTVTVLLDRAISAFGAVGGAVGLLDESRTTIELAVSRGYSDEGMARFQSFSVEEDNPMAEVIRTGRPFYNESGQDLRGRFSGLSETEVAYSSLAMVPLAVARPIGALSLSFGERHRFDDEQKAFLAAAATQAAHSLENVRLYEGQRKLTDRLAFLAEASEVLTASLNPDDILQQFADLAVRRIADWCWIEMLEPDGSLRNVAVAHVDPARVSEAMELRERYPIDEDSAIGVPAVVRTGASELYQEIPDVLFDDTTVDAEHARRMRDLGVESVMIVPLIARGRPLGAVTYVSSDPATRFDAEDLELAEDLARRAALAIDNSMLFNREHAAALSLQRSLLPESLPEVEGFEFAAHYSPGAEGTEVGGDFYEATTLPQGTVSLTIGDVAGRGIPAAAVMGRVRAALRAYVLDGYAPAEVMKRVDYVLRESGGQDMVTIFHLRFDPATGMAEYVRAGHPPAMLRLPDGSVQEFSGAGTPPLGVLTGVEYQAHAAQIPPGSLILFYTDGLIERRGADLGTQLAGLAKALSVAPPDAAGCLEHLRVAFRIDEVPDDVAMLAMVRS